MQYTKNRQWYLLHEFNQWLIFYDILLELKQNFAATHVKVVVMGETCDRMADNAGHGPTSSSKRRARPSMW